MTKTTVKTPVAEGIKYNKLYGWCYYKTYNKKDTTDQIIFCNSKEEAESYLRKDSV